MHVVPTSLIREVSVPVPEFLARYVALAACEYQSDYEQLVG
jgi:hypothetical protein